MQELNTQNKNNLLVIKRDSSEVEFDGNKILLAIKRASKNNKEIDDGLAVIITNLSIKNIYDKYDTNVNIEQIQDEVEEALLILNCFKTYRAYVTYREQRHRAREDKKVIVDVESTIGEYIDREDWRIKANANQGYSLGGMILNTAGKITANYWLSHIYTKEIGEAHRNADYHIHDLDMLSGYCAGWSLRTLLYEGFNGVPGKTEARPPKHFSAAIGQMVNFLGTLQNEWAGAQAFSSFDTYLAPYVRMDKLTYDEVKQNIQEFIYNLNVPSRWGTQTPFTNVTFDWVCPDDLKDQVPVLGGEYMEFTYGDLQVEMDMINKAYIEVMTTGDYKGRVFTFPIPTYNITPEFPWDSENASLLFEMAAKYGLPYFQNFLNSDLTPNMVRSMCCRLQLDLRELLKRGNGLFGSAEQTGSIGVVTINCARLGYLYKGNEEALFDNLIKLADLAKESLELKRKVIQKLMDDGLYPFTKRYLGRLKNHFSTIGINGVNEMIRNFTNDEYNITSEVGKNLAIKVLDTLREAMIRYQEETGNLYNLEASPAEGTNYRFAREDKKRYPDIIQAGTEDSPYYTNSTQLPVGYTDDPFEALDHQEVLQKKYTGGTVLHLYMNERVSSSEACKNLVKTVLTNYRLPYITISPTFSVCPIHGYIEGEHKYCPKCDEELYIKLKKEGKI